jgi:single-stranded-DNA-specific exonuclease
MPREWVIARPAADREAVARRLGISPIVAQVLANRGVSGVEAARQFIRPQMSDIVPPEALPGCTAAARRITEAIADAQPIVIYGDYDVDGITGVSILWHCLRIAGANVSYYVPHRLEEGYGISDQAVASLIDDGAKLIVSVDCGITAVEPAALARRRSAELIITDHHQPRTDASGEPELPDALIVHPGIERDGQPAYPNPHLCGAGVALKLAWAVGQHLSGAAKVGPEIREFLVDAMGLAALGTVADVVPLVGENRVIAHQGLLGLPRSKLPGVQALIHKADLHGKRLEGFDVGFKLGPRLNAIGRMGHARIAVDMLTRASADEAAQIANVLDEQNKARQTLERRIVREAKQMVASQGQDRDEVRAIVLASEGWHAGVIGIVAGRIAESFGKPTVMIALENGVGQGSARSVRHFPLNEAFAQCREHLLTFGGHAMAAGLRIEAQKVDAFRADFQRRAGQLLHHRDVQPRLDLDDEIDVAALDVRLVEDLAKLEPFGEGNRRPIFASPPLEVMGQPRTVGASGAHLQVTLSDGRRQCKGIAFGQAALSGALHDHRRCRVAFRPIINEWNGRKTVEMQIEDFRIPP